MLLLALRSTLSPAKRSVGGRREEKRRRRRPRLPRCMEGSAQHVAAALPRMRKRGGNRSHAVRCLVLVRSGRVANPSETLAARAREACRLSIAWCSIAWEGAALARY